MKELMNDDSIVIRPSDKGSQIVIFETQEYEQLIQDALEDDTTYQETDVHLVCIKKKVETTLKKLVKEGKISN